MTSLSHVFTSLRPSGSFGNNPDLQQVSRNQNLPSKHSPRLSLSSCHVFESSGWVPRMEEGKVWKAADTPTALHAMVHMTSRRRPREADARSRTLVPTHDVLICARLSDSWPRVHTLLGRGCWRPPAPARANTHHLRASWISKMVSFEDTWLSAS